MSTIKIERIGGFAGYGGPHLKSRGEVHVSDLPDVDKQAVEALFKARKKAAGAAGADGFSYKLTRTVDGKAVTVIAPESLVPASVQSQVKDMLE